MLRINRYETAQSLFSNFFSSKLDMFAWKPLPRLRSLELQAGLYRPATLRPEHGLLLSMLGGVPAELHLQRHGKRQRKTLSLNINIRNTHKWAALDKLVHELFPRMQDLVTPKSKKRGHTNTLTMRVRQKFTLIEEFDELLENSMYSLHRGVYLPLTMHVHLTHAFHPSIVESYLRMLRLPVNLYRRRPRPAYDDKLEFVGLEALYRQFSIRRAPKKK